MVDKRSLSSFVLRLVDYIPGFILGTLLSQKLISKVKDIPYEILKQNLVRT
jgi:branched-subunit amino acid transport protein